MMIRVHAVVTCYTPGRRFMCTGSAYYFNARERERERDSHRSVIRRKPNYVCTRLIIKLARLLIFMPAPPVQQ